MIGFEQKLNKVIPAFPAIEVLSLAARAHLTLELQTSAGMLRTSPVVTSENGGYAAQNFTIDLDPNTNRLRWLINPFLFFKLALGDERFPIPDVTTVSGRRIYFSHIDGDGWNNLSEVEGYRQSQALSAEVVTREAIEAFPDLPVSVGLIAADVQPLLGGNARALPWARRLFSLPQVEVASHTHTHPYNWQFFESYSRDAEEGMIRGYRPPDMPMRERLTAAMTRAAGKTYANARYDPYIAGTDDLPRTYLRQPFELEKEVMGALKFSEQFAPSGKRAKLYLWSGDTTPFEGAVNAVRRAGARNMNGGDSRLDREYPSVAYVPALSRQIGNERQIYAVNSNENTYTNDWTGPFGGQMMLEHTLQNTDSPAPPEGLQSLLSHVLRREAGVAARHQTLSAHGAQGTVAPIDASHYAAMADDFFGVEIEQVDLFAWAITQRGAVQTMRLDEAEQTFGRLCCQHRRDRGNAQGRCRLRDARSDGRARGSGLQGTNRRRARQTLRPTSRWRPSCPAAGGSRTWSRATASSRFRTFGYGAAEMSWQTEQSRGFRVSLDARRRNAGRRNPVERRHGHGSTLKFAVDGIAPADLTFQCHE